MIMVKHYGQDWKSKCERSLLLAKKLGNIYTGSLYNGLLSLICDESIDLKGKNVMLFSYGSGCAASMFMLRGAGDYKKLQQTAQFKERLNSRIKISPQEFDEIMSERERNYGKSSLVPRVRKYK